MTTATVRPAIPNVFFWTAAPGTKTSYTPSRTTPRCRPPVPGHQPRREAAANCWYSRSSRPIACVRSGLSPTGAAQPEPPHLRPVLVVEAGQDRDLLVLAPM